MAGKELYIEPILDANLNVVPGLSENIAQMTAQLNETTRILTNVLANQGLEAHQKAYNGSAFSSLTVNNNAWDMTRPNTAVLSLMTSGGNEVCTASEVSDHISVSGGQISFGIYLRPEFSEEEYSTPEKLEFSYGSDQVFSKISVKATFWFPSGPVEITEESNLSIGSVTFTLPAEVVGAQLPSVNFDCTITAADYSNKRFVVYMPVLKTTGESDVTIVNKRIKKLAFNTANAFTFYAPAASGSVTADISNVIIPQRAFISLPDIIDVGTWAVFLTNGSIDGVNMALVDDTSHDLLVTLPAATSDISSLTQTSNLALSVSMTEQTQVINSIAQRYY